MTPEIFAAIAKLLASFSAVLDTAVKRMEVGIEMDKARLEKLKKEDSDLSELEEKLENVSDIVDSLGQRHNVQVHYADKFEYRLDRIEKHLDLPKTTVLKDPRPEYEDDDDLPETEGNGGSTTDRW